MRILHILDHSAPLHSGYTFRTLDILTQQRRMGWQTFQLTSAKQGVRVTVQDIDGWRFFRTPPPIGWWVRLPVMNHVGVIASLARRLRQIAGATRPQILHAHSPSLNAIAALLVGRALDIPVVYEVRACWEDAAVEHGTAKPGSLRYRLSRALETYALRRADAVTTICAGLQAEIAARGIAATRISVIPNAVDLARFSIHQGGRSILAHTMGLSGRLVLGFVGSFYSYEGLKVLIAAMPRMLAAVPSLHLLLIGGGPDEESLRALVAELGLQHKVSFTGRVAHQKIADYYQLIDILIYPRLATRLTELVTPLKPLEAMAQGCLVVASDVGGHREMIEHGKTGILFTAGDANALADQVIQLLRQPGTWPALREQARAYVERERNWSVVASRYREVYERVLVDRHD